MRFSLGTFVLFILFISSTYAVVMQRHSWYLEQIRPSAIGESFDDLMDVSPDGTQRLGSLNQSLSRHDLLLVSRGVKWDSVAVFENALFNTAQPIPICKSPVAYAGFKSDSEIRLAHFEESYSYAVNDVVTFNYQVQIFKRRYAETIWSYIARPEFLLMIATSACYYSDGIKALNVKTQSFDPLEHRLAESHIHLRSILDIDEFHRRR